MNVKMFVQCHGCGFTECLDLGAGGFDEQEKELNRVIDKGWRFASAWDDFVCPTCAQAGGSTDKLYALVSRKPKLCGALMSYVELRDRAERHKAQIGTMG